MTSFRINLLSKNSLRGHVAKEHLDGNEIDENGAFVARAFPVAMLECVGQVVFGRPEVVVEHVLASDIKFVRHLLRFWIPEKCKYKICQIYVQWPLGI